MAINKSIFRQLRIVPLRFTRCANPADPDVESGPARADCPDPDDRGYSDTAHAPILPVAFDSNTGRGDAAHVKVIRQNIENSAELFVDSDTPGVLDVTSPAAGVALPARQNAIIRLQAQAAGNARIRVKLGSGASAPIIAELAARVAAIIPVDVVLHRSSITGAGAGPPDPALIPLVGGVPDFSRADALLDGANIIWRPHAVRFRVIARRQSTIADTNAGVLSQTGSPPSSPQLTPLLTTNRQAHAINVHFIRRIGTGSTRGLGVTLVLAPTTYGVALPDGADSNDLAHELGHVLNLDFFAAPAGGGAHADDEPGGKRTDIWTTRRLMHSFNPFAPAQAYQADVGYGANNRGGLITMKNIAIETTDDEDRVARTSATPPLP